jgi:hypothetical protein
MNYGVRRSKGPSPQILIGIVILVVAVLMLCVAGFFFVNNYIQQQQAANATPVPGPQPEMDVPTAREAYPAAVELARAQDPGAQLTSAAGEWTPTIHRDNLNAGRTSWTYYFYMPATHEIVWVTVGRGGEDAQITNTVSWDTPPTVIDDQTWQTDSAQAMTAAMQKCQSTLNNYPDSTVEARLSLAASEQAILWRITVTPPDPQAEPCQARVDGTIGVLR